LNFGDYLEFGICGLEFSALIYESALKTDSIANSL